MVEVNQHEDINSPSKQTMGSSTKINSIEIDLTDANNEVDVITCHGFFISGFISELRGSNRTICWPFREESASLGLWPSLSCTRNIDADGTNDSGLPSNGLNGSSSIIPSQSALNSLTAIDQERNTGFSDNPVVENEDVNCDRSQPDDQRDNPVVENEDVNCQRSQQNDQTTGNAVVENEDVNCERSQKDQRGNNALVVNEDVNCERSQQQDRRVTRSSKKVHPPPFRTYALRNKSNKNAVEKPIGNKRAEKQPNVEHLAVTEIAASVEDAEPEEPESRSLFIGGAPTWRRRTSRSRRLADVSSKPKTRRVESSSMKESLSNKKRKSLPRSSTLSKKVSTAGAASGNASKTVDSNHGGTESTETGVDIDPIKGKKKNVRFEVDDEDDWDPEVDDQNDWDPYPQRAKRTKKVKIAKKKRATRAVDPSNKASSSSVQPSLNENETVPSPPREQGTEERGVGTSLDDQLASEGDIRTPNPPVNERQETNRTKPRYVSVFGNPSIPNTGRGLGTGPNAIYFGGSSSNGNNNQRDTPPSTVVAAQASVPQKDATTIPSTARGLGTGPGAIFLGRRSRTNSNISLRSTPPSTVVAAQSAVPQQDASLPNIGRGLGTGQGAIFLGSSSATTNNNRRSTPSSTQVAAQSAVPQQDATIPNTSRGLGTGRGAIYLGRRSGYDNNNLRSTPSSTQVAAQSTVPQQDATIPNTGRGLGTGRGAIYLGSRSSNLRSTPPSTLLAAQSTVPQKDATIPNTGRGLGTGRGAIYLGRRSSNLRSTPPSTLVAAQSTVPQKDATIPNTGRELGTGRGAIYLGRRSSNLRSTPPSTVVAAQSSVPQKDASVSDRKGKGIMIQSHDERDDLPNREVNMSNNLPQEVPQRPKTPFLFDLNETYEEDVTSLEENNNAAREEDRTVPVRSEQTPMQNSSYVASSSVMPPPPVQESRHRSSILFPGHNPQRMGNGPMASPYHHPSPSTYQPIRAPSPPVWASSMIPPQYHHHHHHHHLSPPAPFNMEYSSMFGQAPSSDTWNLSQLGAQLMNQAMMSGMDRRFRSNSPVDHHGNFVFPPRHVNPVNQLNQLRELQRSHERTPFFPRTISNQGRFQQRRNVASSSNASASPAENSYGSSTCTVSRYPGEITDIEPYMVGEEDLHVPERMAEFEQDEDQVGPFTESG